MFSAAASQLKSSPSLLASSPLQLPKIGCWFSQVLTAYYLAEWQFESEVEGNLNLHSSSSPTKQGIYSTSNFLQVDNFISLKE